MPCRVNRVVKLDISCRRRVNDEGIVHFVDTCLAEDPQQLFVRVPRLSEISGLFLAPPEVLGSVFEDIVCRNHVDTLACFDEVFERPTRSVYHMPEETVRLVVVAVLGYVQ